MRYMFYGAAAFNQDLQVGIQAT
ncbi:hypothetical protein [Aliivibrio fischeri]